MPSLLSFIFSNEGPNVVTSFPGATAVGSSGCASGVRRGRGSMSEKGGGGGGEMRCRLTCSLQPPGRIPAIFSLAQTLSSTLDASISSWAMGDVL